MIAGGRFERSRGAKRDEFGAADRPASCGEKRGHPNSPGRGLETPTPESQIQILGLQPLAKGVWDLRRISGFKSISKLVLVLPLLCTVIPTPAHGFEPVNCDSSQLSSASVRK